MKTPAQNPNPIDKDRVLKHLSGIVRELKDEKAREEYKKLGEELAELRQLESDGLISPAVRLSRAIERKHAFVEKVAKIMAS